MVTASRTAICYLPGRWNNTNLWAFDHPGRDIRTGLAERGHVVAGVRYRTSRLQCDVDALANCRTADLLADVQETVNDVRAAAPGAALILVGYSLGAALACLAAAAICRSGRPLAGLVLLDGGLSSSHPHNVDGASYRTGVMRSPAWEPRFRRQGLAALSEGWDWASLGSRYPLLASLVRDADQLRYLMLGVDEWWPVGQVQEMRELAGNDRLEEEMAAVAVPVLGICSAALTDSSARCAGTVAALDHVSATLHRLPSAWSHIDVVSHPSVARTWDVISTWIHRIVGGNGSGDKEEA